MRSLTIILLCLVMSACAAPGSLPYAERLFEDRLFALPANPVRVDAIMAPSPAMREYLAGTIAPQISRKGRQKALFDALYTQGGLKLEYDAAMTRNAREAFDAKMGNCLSLVIMTAAFARELGLEVRYQTVFTDAVWTRLENLHVLNQHVNLVLGRKARASPLETRDAAEMTIDFLPPEDLGRQRTRVIAERTVLAMYMNNRAAESLGQGRLDEAYWWARESVRQDPAYLTAFNTLGVIYLRRGQAPLAERVFRQLLEQEPDNPDTLSNFALTLDAAGKTAEAAVVRGRLARIEPHPPFHFFNLGIEAMRRRDYAAARDYFQREVQRAAYYHEFHFWLAMAQAQLGDLSEARLQLALAREHATTRGDHELYADKLKRLKSGPR